MNKRIDMLALLLSSGFLLMFVLFAVFDSKILADMVNRSFAWATQYFGAYWQLLLLANFAVGIGLSWGRTGSVRLGKMQKPELSTFQWLALIMCTLLAGGGVFWAAGEPIAHFVSPPPTLADAPNSFVKATNALSQSYMHWGFLAWSILGTLTAIILMYLHYEKNLPLKPRVLLYPLFGERVLGRLGSFIDGFCIIAVAAGTIGPIGFLGLQISYALHLLFNINDTFSTQSIIIILAIVIYMASSLRGLARGIQILSRWNVILAAGLMVFILFFGPTQFIVDSYVQALGTVVQNFIPMASFRGDSAWLSLWTIFFWGWFLGYGPVMAIFIARISRGRNIRELIIAMSVLAPLITMFWFTIVGGAGLYYEITNTGSISNAFSGFNIPASLLAITQSLPLPLIMSILFLILAAIFIITTGDSMTYSISVIICGDINPSAWIRIFFGILMGLVAIVLIAIGESSIMALQSFIVITAVPVSLILLPSLWNAVSIARRMADEQNLR